MTHIGQYALAARLQRGLTPQGLASKLGYQNSNRGARRVLHLWILSPYVSPPPRWEAQRAASAKVSAARRLT